MAPSGRRAASILLTRPAGQNQTLRDALETMGFEVFEAPLLRVVPLAVDDMTHAPCPLLISSINAVGLLPPSILATHKHCPVFTTGDATAAALRNIGFTDVIAGTGPVRTLLPELRNHLERTGSEHVLYPCAQQLAFNPTPWLAERGITCTLWPLYHTEAVSHFPSDVEERLLSTGMDAVILMSRHTAQTFCQLWDAMTTGRAGQSQPPAIITFSEDITRFLPDHFKSVARHPPEPSLTALLALVRQLRLSGSETG